MPSFTTLIAGLQATGPIIEVVIGPPTDLVQALKQQQKPIPKSVKVNVMIDTGATSCVVNPHVIQTMGLNPVGTANVNTPSSTNVSCLQYKAKIFFPGNYSLETSELVEMPLQGQHIQCLISRDILKHGVLIYNGYMQTITFSV